MAGRPGEWPLARNNSFVTMAARMSRWGLGVRRRFEPQFLTNFFTPVQHLWTDSVATRPTSEIIALRGRNVIGSSF